MVNYKKVLSVSLVVLILAGCQKTPETVERNGVVIGKDKTEQSEVSLEEQTALGQSSAGQSATGQSSVSYPDVYQSEIPSGEYRIKIDAEVIFPDAAVTKGTIKVIPFEYEMIKDVFAPDIDFQPVDYDEYTDCWAAADDGVDKSIPSNWEKSIMIDKAPSANVFYTDSIISRSMPAGASVVPEGDITSEQQQMILSSEDIVQNILDELHLNMKITKTSVCKDNTTAYTSTALTLCLDGVACGKFDSESEAIVGRIDIMNGEIGEFYCTGNYEINDCEAVELLSWDELMQCFNKLIENQTLIASGPESVITEISLKYMVKSDEKGNYSYLPVWCFRGEDEFFDDGKVTYAAINAVDGQLEFSMGGYI